MNAPSSHYYDLAQKLLAEGYDKIHILNELKRHGADRQLIQDITHNIIHKKSNRNLRVGFLCVIIGAGLLFSSFLFTITSTYSDATTGFGLYGLTGIGICIVMYGFYLIFG